MGELDLTEATEAMAQEYVRLTAPTPMIWECLLRG